MVDRASWNCSKMVIYTEAGLRRISRIFDLYDSGAQLSTGDLLLARDYANVQLDQWTDWAHMIADRLGVEPTWYRMTTVEQIRRCKEAFNTWKRGLAEPADMVDAMNYCMYQADTWDDEKAIIAELIAAELTKKGG